MVVLSPLLHPHLWDGGLRGPRPPVSPYNFISSYSSIFLYFHCSQIKFNSPLKSSSFSHIFFSNCLIHSLSFQLFMCSLSIPIVHVFTFTFHINHSFVHFHFSFPNLLISLFPRLLKFIFCREVSLTFCLFGLWLVWLAIWFHLSWCCGQFPFWR